MSGVFCGQALASTESATSGQSATYQCLSVLPGRLGRGKFVQGVCIQTYVEGCAGVHSNICTGVCIQTYLEGCAFKSSERGVRGVCIQI